MAKQLLVCWLMLIAPMVALAQAPTSPSASIDSNSFEFVSKQARLSFQAQYSGNPERAEKMYGRWESFWSLRAGHNSPSSTDRSVSAGLFLDKFLKGTLGPCLGGTDQSNWSCIGPFRNSFGQNGISCQKVGRVNALWVDPDDQNTLLAGAAAGGIWKTTDGGQNWANITDQSQDVVTGTMGITDIAVNPLNKQVIYAATGTTENFIDHWDGKYGLGLIRSSNGGQSWTADSDFRTVSGSMSVTGPDHVEKVAYRPGTEVLYAVMGKRVFKKPASYLPWQDITPLMITGLAASYLITDFEFTSSPVGRVVFGTNCQGNEQYLFIYDELSNSWQSRTIIIPGYANGGQGANRWGIQEIALSAADMVFMRLSLDQSGTSYNLLYKVGLGLGSTPVLVNNNPIDLKDPKELVVSPANANIIYLTNAYGHPDFIYRSTDGGASFPDKIGETHADGRCLVLYQATNSAGGIDDILYAGTDGGVAKKSAGNTMFHSITGNGLCITQFYGLSSNPANDGMLTAGAQDNGSQSYHKANTAVPWSETNGQGLAWGDGLRSAFARNGITKSYTQTNGSMSLFQFGSTVGYNTGITPPSVDAAPSPSFLRSIQFDGANTARLGYHYIWKQQIGAPSWDLAFNNEIKPYGFNSDSLIEKTSVDFMVSERQPDKAYLAYLRPNWDPAAYATEFYGRLFYTDNATSNSGIFWRNVTPALTKDFTITDIETDPKVPERVWVSFGNTDWGQLNVTSGSRQNRVLYSSNAGLNNSWVDVSKGLPPLPILKLLYVEGTDDVLFAATDVGVYRWNKAAQQWECFDNGMPKVIVTDMEMNYCSGKLRVATFGRGIWETPIDPNATSLTPVGETVEISSNTTWNTSKTINGSIRIKGDATLTISGAGTTIYMPSRGKIAVEKGARLIIDGARLTNECDGAMWLGIQLSGDPNAPADPSYQGYLELKNNAMLEHARLAISNFDWDENTGGGIIKASNSSINNCKMAVCLNNYSIYTYFTPGTTQSNCSFNNIKFIKDDPRYEIDAGGYFTSWLIQGGVDIRNCTFRYSVPWQDVPYAIRASGINASATGLRVENSSFDGYRRGIYLNGYDGSPTRNALIYYNFFDHNSENITIDVDPYADIRGNVIRNMYPYLSKFSYKNAFGIYLNRAAGAYVGCGNSISGTTDGGPDAIEPVNRLGLIANNNLWNDISVTDNTFSQLSTGTQTQGYNYSLNIFCNTYDKNKLAWAVNPQSTDGFLNDQGSSCDPVTGIRTGNRFTTNNNDIVSYMNTSYNNWDYFSGNGANEQPFWSGQMTMNYCATSENSQCNNLWACPIRFMIRANLGGLVEDYSGLVSAGGKYSYYGRALQRQIVWAYNDVEDEPGLRTFLESENDDASRRLLIPMYINAGMYDKAVSTGNLLDLSNEEKQAYTNYYTIMANLKQQGRTIHNLTTSELATMHSIAGAGVEVSPMATGLLEYAYGLDRELLVEQLPMNPMSKTIKIPETPGRQPSELADAAPNPAAQSTVILATVNSADAALAPKLVIRSTAGLEVWKTKLQAGENRITVPVKGWQSGIYFYSLEVQDKVIATKKLSVIP